MTSVKITVSVGIISNNNQEILLLFPGSRAVLPHLWGFPGGKIEPDETPYQALCRELWEEIGITVLAAQELPTVSFLSPWWVEKFHGVPQSIEGQHLEWIAWERLSQLPMPELNRIIIEEFSVRRAASQRIAFLDHI